MNSFDRRGVAKSLGSFLPGGAGLLLALVSPGSPFALLTVKASPPSEPEALALFESKIRPVLAVSCYECHSAEAEAKGRLKGGLFLDTREGMIRGGDSGPALVAGNPSQSLLMRALKHESEDLAMPAKAEKLSPSVIADFEHWIATGAFDPRDGSPPAIRKTGMSLEEGRRHWSLVAPVKPSSPAVKDSSWPRGEIDRFLLRGLEDKGMKPNPDASPGALALRLHLDLIGLPPQSDEEPDPEALIDRLLDSPHFGERWGRHWLDVARYADSNGRDRNVIFHHAWRYRDYVIASFNADKPYDRFLREQLAGDLIVPAEPERRDELLTATAFLALGAKAYEESKQDLYWMDVADEQIEVIGRGILGLSIACARCHDHKFDPIPTADYYAIAGILRSTEPLYGYGPRGIKATAFHHTEWHAIGPEAATLAPAALEYFRRLDQETLTMHEARSKRYGIQKRLPEAKAKVESAATAEEKAAAEAELKKKESEIADWNVKIAALEKGVADLQDAAPPQPGWTLGARDRSEIRDCRIHHRGETTRLGDEVPRGFLQVIPLADVPAPPADRSGRLELARWITHRDHPLTARVMVNRVWEKLMGRGLVTSPDDFGVNGARPSHPELLDYLAVRFMDEGWSVKRLIREIVTSRAYRMSSDADAGNLEKDPDNTTFWRMSPRPLEVEVLRDRILAFSGRLNPYPPGEPFLARFHPRKDAELFSFKPFLTPEMIVDDHRGVYLPVVRGVLPEMFPLFDFAPPERSMAEREESIVPAQALFLMNHPWVIEQAGHAARRVLTDSRFDEDRERVARLYELAFSRPPSEEEVERALAFLAGQERPVDASAAATPTAGLPAETRWTSLCQVLVASAEFRIVR